MLVGRRFLSLADTALSPEFGGWGWACGYPVQSVVQGCDPSGRTETAFHRLNLPGILRTARPADALANYHDRLHFLLDSPPDEMFDETGETQAVLPDRYGGISGTAVWQGLWPSIDTPSNWYSNRVRMVGVQTGVYRNNTLVKATTWLAVLLLIVRQFPDLWGAVNMWFPDQPDLVRAHSLPR